MPRPTLSATVFAAVAEQILGGDLAPGAALPSERALSAELGVNRHAVREAVKRLQQAGLVSVSHGGPTRVRDWLETGGLDLLAALPPSGTQTLVRDALEMRLAIGADAARRCAERAPQLGGELARAVDAAAGLERDDDRAAAYEELWRRIVIGAANTAYRLSLNSLVSAGEGIGLRAMTLPEATDAPAQRKLASAIAAADPDRAERAARALLERTRAPLAAEVPA